MAARSKRGAAAAVSIAVHLAVLAILALSTPILRLPTARFAPDIALDLSRPPLDRRKRAQPAAVSAPRPAAASVAKPALAAAVPVPTPAPPKVTTPNLPASPPPAAPTAPSAPAPAGVAPGPASTAGSGHDWRVRPEDGDARGAVRAAIGCGHIEHLKLTAEEQAACLRRLGDLRGAQLPHYDAVPPDKRAYYDAVVAAYAKMHAGTPLPFTVVGPGTNLVSGERWAGPPGAHMPGFGCKMPFGIPKGWKAPKGGPPHSLKLGPLPCFITPPSGFLTEEADLPSPVDLPARK